MSTSVLNKIFIYLFISPGKNRKGGGKEGINDEKMGVQILLFVSSETLVSGISNHETVLSLPPNGHEAEGE